MVMEALVRIERWEEATNADSDRIKCDNIAYRVYVQVHWLHSADR